MSGFEDDPRAEGEDTTGCIISRGTEFNVTSRGGSSSLNDGQAAMTKQQRDRMRIKKLKKESKQ